MKNIYILLIGIAMLFTSCSDDNFVPPDFDENVALKKATKPNPNLLSTLDLTLSPTSPTNLWNGTIDFGDFRIYNIAFFTLTPPPENFEGVYLFNEDFIIYELGTDWNLPENVVLKGSHKGQLVFANTFPESVKLNANGKITEAYAPFEMCLDRTFHAKGTVSFTSLPAPTALLVMRIN